MVYVKAYAEVISLNNEDIETKVISGLSGDTKLEDIIGLYSEEDIRDTIGSPYISNDFLNFVRNVFAGNAVSNAVNNHMTLDEAKAYVESVHERCESQGNIVSEFYSADEEDDSFDSEW